MWDGHRWAADDTAEVSRLAKQTVRGIYAEAAALEDKDERAALAKHALRSENTSRLAAMITAAAFDERVVVTPRQLDADPWLLNCRNGTVELRTGELRPPRPEELLTKLVPIDYDPAARSPVWERFLETATEGDRGYLAFLQRAAGYSLTADTGEEKLFFVHGEGGAGKSTFIEALKAALGEYAQTADFDTFLARRDVGGPRNDVARLAGARFVCSIEVDEGKRLAEGLVKTLTGGDTVTARFLHREAFEFRPALKLWLVANHAPRVKDDDSAIWRRILRLPFDNVLPQAARDPQVKKTLTDPAASGAAILAWAVRGCLAWQREGLGAPEAVERATDAYRAAMDPIAGFFEQCCALVPDAWTPVRELRAAYEGWCKDSGSGHPLSGQDFAGRLKTKRCELNRRNGVRGYLGIGLLAGPDAPPAGPDGGCRVPPVPPPTAGVPPPDRPVPDTSAASAAGIRFALEKNSPSRGIMESGGTGGTGGTPAAGSPPACSFPAHRAAGKDYPVQPGARFLTCGVCHPRPWRGRP